MCNYIPFPTSCKNYNTNPIFSVPLLDGCLKCPLCYQTNEYIYYEYKCADELVPQNKLDSACYCSSCKILYRVGCCIGEDACQTEMIINFIYKGKIYHGSPIFNSVDQIITDISDYGLTWICTCNNNCAEYNLSNKPYILNIINENKIIAQNKSLFKSVLDDILIKGLKKNKPIEYIKLLFEQQIQQKQLETLLDKMENELEIKSKELEIKSKELEVKSIEFLHRSNELSRVNSEKSSETDSLMNFFNDALNPEQNIFNKILLPSGKEQIETALASDYKEANCVNSINYFMNILLSPFSC
jgi:hypothetical protein